MKAIEDKIDELFEKEAKDRPDDLRAFVGRVVDKHPSAEKMFRRYFVFIVTLCCIGALINMGFVEEASLASFKVSALKNLLLAWPPMLGITAYLMYSSVAASLLLTRAVSQAYKHLLPAVASQDLEYLLSTDTVFGIERLLEPGNEDSSPRFVRAIHSIWEVMYIGITLLLAPGAIVYFTFILWTSMKWPIWVVIVSSLIGVMPIVRGYILWFWASQAVK